MSRTIASMRARLHSVVTDWVTDGCHPPNYIRETGMGEVVAKVDRWCGGYQSVHEPVMIGWQAQRGNRVMKGIIMVDYHNEPTKTDAVNAAINMAKIAASKALKELKARK